MTTATPDLTHAIARALASPYVYRTVMPRQGGPELRESPPPIQVIQIPGAALSPEAVAALRRCWERGDSTRTAAAECGVSQPTASRYYRRFRAGAAPAARG